MQSLLRVVASRSLTRSEPGGIIAVLSTILFCCAALSL
jgi:hypothetical protein